MALKGKYKVIKGDDGKYKLTKNDTKSQTSGKPFGTMDKEALEARISKEKKGC